MKPALQRLLAAQNAQMEHMESASTSLADHLLFWSAVREENTLLHAARRKNVTALGLFPVPTLATSAAAAKAAIEMELILKELLQTPWATDPWSLSDVSRELYLAPPKHTLKKKGRVAEVMFDGDPNNRNWYTVWEEVYMRLDSGWIKATGCADETGLYLKMPGGGKQYYTLFAEDAEQYSVTGSWQVADRDQTFTFPPACRDGVDGTPGPPGHRPAATPGGAPAEPNSPSRCDPPGPDRRDSTGRRGWRSHPYILPGSKGVLVTSSGTSSVQSPVSEVPEPVPEEVLCGPSSPDTTGSVDPSDCFDLFHGLLAAPCLLIHGSANGVKCLRHRLKRHHRRRFGCVTTTFWAAGDEGSQRDGLATIMVTFTSEGQRQNFVDNVSIPANMTVRKIAVHAS